MIPVWMHIFSGFFMLAGVGFIGTVCAEIEKRKGHKTAALVAVIMSVVMVGTVIALEEMVRR